MIGCRVLLAASLLAAAIGANVGMLSAAPRTIDAKREQIGDLQRVLAAYDSQAGAAAAEHNRALDRLDLIRARERDTRSAIQQTRVDLTVSQERLAQRLVGLYVDGEPSLIDIILRSGSVSDLVTVGDLLQATARSDAAVIGSVRERRDRLDALRRRLAADGRRAAGEVEVIRVKEARLRTLVADRQRALAGARSELGALLRAEEQRLARLAAEKRARAAAASRASTATAYSSAGSVSTIPGGSHVYPLAGSSTFSDDWLASRPGGRYHEGIDLFAARGTPVVAVADGTLFRVGYSGISGNRLWLRDGAGTEFFYAHLDGYSPAAREGATVTRGTVIGYNGDTGDARGTAPHVHFQIHPGGGGPVRPYPIVSAWPRVG